MIHLCSIIHLSCVTRINLVFISLSYIHQSLVSSWSEIEGKTYSHKYTRPWHEYTKNTVHGKNAVSKTSDTGFSYKPGESEQASKRKMEAPRLGGEKSTIHSGLNWGPVTDVDLCEYCVTKEAFTAQFSHPDICHLFTQSGKRKECVFLSHTKNLAFPSVARGT